MNSTTVASTSSNICSNVSLSQGIGNIFNFFSCILTKTIIPLLFTLATAAFIWGIIQYFLNPDNEEKRKAGKSYMLWGLISLFVMIAMWGLVGIIANTFGVPNLLPQLPTGSR